MSRLFPFQQGIKTGVFNAWREGCRAVLVESATGSGKTVILADIVKTMDRAAAVIAHRSELVTQISLSLAREGVRHRIIGADSVRKNCVTLQMDELGRSFFDATSRVGVCSVDTLDGRDPAADPWFAQVGLWVQDEAHHVLRGNKWGRAALMFPNAYGLGVTATPSRADGKGLGSGDASDGLFDRLIKGPGMRSLIDAGYLTDYKIFAPPSDVDYSSVTVTASGDLSPAKLSAAVHASDSIVGDVVRSYKDISMRELGRLGLGVTFAVDVKAAQELAAAFNADGVPAEIVSAKTPDILRQRILARFARRDVLQLINVDLFGEGFDLPAIEIVSMVRKTESWPLYVQQFGRVLRLMRTKEQAQAWGTYSDVQRLAAIAASPKRHGIIIDHVGNIFRHGVPDAVRETSLARRGSRASAPSDAIPMRICANDAVGGVEGRVCGKSYERFRKCCPHCDYYPEPAARSDPKFVDGDLYELDAATLAALRGGVVDLTAAPKIPQHLDPIAAAGVRKAQEARGTAQYFLRELMAVWAGWQRAQGVDDSQSYRIFYHAFGIDVLSAQALGRPEAEALTLKIKAQLDAHNVQGLTS